MEFAADGRPRSKGSHVAQVNPRTRKVRAAAVQEDDLDHWTRAVRGAVTLQRPTTWAARHAGPVLVLARFLLVRPRRLADTMRAEAPLVVPDVDKLERALLDALTGLVFADDRQVVATAMLKTYASPLERPGVTGVVVALDDLEAEETPPVAILAGELERWRMTWP